MDPHPRLPLQGGLAPGEGADVSALPVVEVACDESGFSGTNLLDAATPVFVHASVDLSIDEAAGVVDGLRSGLRRPVGEFKSSRLLRGPRAGESLGPFLTELTGRAHVQVVDKEYFLVTRVVDLFLAEPSYAAGTGLSEHLRPAALTLYRAGRARAGLWDAFLAAFVELVRTKRSRPPGRRVLDAFFRAQEALADGLDPEAAAVLAGLTRTRTRAVLTRLARGDPVIPPPLEPLLPALAETVRHWSGGRRPVLVVHDEQSALTATRLRRLQQVLADGGLSPFAGLVTVDSRDDPRVQVADVLAGVVRRSADVGRDPLLRPFLSPTSLRDPDRTSDLDATADDAPA